MLLLGLGYGKLGAGSTCSLTSKEVRAGWSFGTLPLPEETKHLSLKYPVSCPGVEVAPCTGSGTVGLR